MSTVAALAAIDTLLAVIDRVSKVAEVFAQARAEGREVNMDDVRAARTHATTALDALDAAIAAADTALLTAPDVDQP